MPAAAVVLALPGTAGGRLAIPLACVLFLELLAVGAFPFGVADGQFGDPALPVLVDGSPVALLGLVVVPLVGVLLYALRFGQPWGASTLGPAAAAIATIAVPALAWTALDFARANLDPGALWGPLFLSQADQQPGSLAVLGGPWLITLALVAVNYGIAGALVRRRALYAAVPVSAALALIAVAGTAAAPGGEGARQLRVAAIQPGYDTANETRRVLRRFEPGTWDVAALDLIGDLGRLTRAASRRGAEVAVWPEASMYVDPRREPRVRNALVALSRSTDTTIIVPFFDRPAKKGYALAAVPTAGGSGARLTVARPKQRPAWVVGEQRAEGELEPIDAAGLRVGTLLGTDPQDARLAAALADEDAALLVSATHDWRQSAAPQEAHARLATRASGLALVRADWRYRSAIYARDGERLAHSGGDRSRAVLVADVSVAAAATPYASIGDLVGWLAVGASLAALTAAGLSSRGSRRGAPPLGSRARPRPGGRQPGRAAS